MCPSELSSPSSWEGWHSLVCAWLQVRLGLRWAQSRSLEPSWQIFQCTPDKNYLLTWSIHRVATRRLLSFNPGLLLGTAAPPLPAAARGAGKAPLAGPGSQRGARCCNRAPGPRPRCCSAPQPGAAPRLSALRPAFPAPPRAPTRARPASAPPPGAAAPARARGTARSQNGAGDRSASGGCEQAGIREDGGDWSVRAGRAGAGMGLLRLGPGPVLAAGLGNAARRCHHPLGGHRGREDPAAGERPEGRGALPTRLRRHGEPPSAPPLSHGPGLRRAVWRGARGSSVRCEALPVPAAAAAAGRRCRSLPRPPARVSPAASWRRLWNVACIRQSPGARHWGGVVRGSGRAENGFRLELSWEKRRFLPRGRSRGASGTRPGPRFGGESSGTALPARNRDPSGAGAGHP